MFTESRLVQQYKKPLKIQTGRPSRYEPGGPEVVIQITPNDLGITAGTPAPSKFEIYASDIFNDFS